MKRKFRKIFTSTDWSTDLWPAMLLWLAVFVPAICLLWFMNAAMRNERFAVSQKLAEAYRSRLVSERVRLEGYWKNLAAELEAATRDTPAPAAFAQCVRSGKVDSLLIFEAHTNLIYPNTPSGWNGNAHEQGPKWAEAGNLEYVRKEFHTAAQLYDVLARESTNTDLVARAVQAEARCLVEAGEPKAAIHLIEEIFSEKRFQAATDPQGRLIAANAELMALELSTNRASPAFQATAARLKQRLLDYNNPMLTAPQRRFLMKEMAKLAPQQAEFPTLPAEELAARICEAHPVLAPNSAIQHAPIPQTYQFLTSSHRLLAVVSEARLLASVRATSIAEPWSTDAEISLLPPSIDGTQAFVSAAAGDFLPGWRLALSPKDKTLFESRSKHDAAVYFWTGLLVIAVMSILALCAVRVLRRQTELATMKNDLAAIVSHELKTPLSSMRVFVDTLLDSKEHNEKTVREYLELIARENQRLTRLIQNFLAFSRMERNKHTFRFISLPANGIIASAVDAMRDRLEAPGCLFEARVEPNLPHLRADPEAISTALINLLDNAWKYSEDNKKIRLSARAQNGHVSFSVEDNGIGIAPGERKKIFHQFYQVDKRLSREGGGCGLGLSIVRFIVEAHHGTISVSSLPGQGSTFTLTLPAVQAPIT